jgi:hypothetical protein
MRQIFPSGGGPGFSPTERTRSSVRHRILRKSRRVTEPAGAGATLLVAHIFAAAPFSTFEWLRSAERPWLVGAHGHAPLRRGQVLAISGARSTSDFRTYGAYFPQTLAGHRRRLDRNISLFVRLHAGGSGRGGLAQTRAKRPITEKDGTNVRKACNAVRQVTDPLGPGGDRLRSFSQARSRNPSVDGLRYGLT